MPLHLDAGLEPVAGYTLVRLLGRGGFGEVWEAQAPGGVRVALKFIRLDSDQAGPEQRALEVIRNIRHPHLLDVQFAIRVEDCLVIAMPLCDESLMDRLRACQGRGLPGLPRDELLGYMDELARAVDFLNEPRHSAERWRHLVGSSTATSSRTTSSWSAARRGWPTSGWPRSWRRAAPATRER